MSRILLPPHQERAIIRRRRKEELYRYDEVWDGVHVVSPIADDEHQHFGYRLALAFTSAFDDDPAVRVVPGGLNISDRDDWRKNYRIPDVCVFLPGNPAINKRTHWRGGPDFAVEVLSRGELPLKKLAFYAAVGVRELLHVRRRPWRIELRKREGTGWAEPLISTVDDPTTIRSDVLRLDLRLVPGPERPRVEVARGDGRTWLA